MTKKKSNQTVEEQPVEELINKVEQSKPEDFVVAIDKKTTYKFKDGLSLGSYFLSKKGRIFLTESTKSQVFEEKHFFSKEYLAELLTKKIIEKR